MDLKELHKNPMYRKIINLITKNNPTGAKEFEIDAIATWHLKEEGSEDISYKTIETAAKTYFKKLEEAGYGRYMPGRWSQKSRFVFTHDPLFVRDIATGAVESPTAPPELVSPAPVYSTEVVTVAPTFFKREEHLKNAGFTEPRRRQESFTLRKGREVKLEIPEDFSKSEAERLSMWIKALPYVD